MTLLLEDEEDSSKQRRGKRTFSASISIETGYTVPGRTFRGNCSTLVEERQEQMRKGVEM
jgi:hypothetical protein